MKYFVYAGMALLALALFLPANGSAKPRNLPLLLFLFFLVAFFYLLKVFQYINLVRKTKKLLKQYGWQIKKTKILPFGSFLRGHYSILASKGEQTYSILFLLCKRRYYRYHFADAHILKMYVTNRVMLRTSGLQTVHRTNILQTKKVGERILEWQTIKGIPTTKFLIMNKLPDCVTDAKTKEGGLGNGDLICDTVHLYDFSGFSEAVKDEKLRENKK